MMKAVKCLHSALFAASHRDASFRTSLNKSFDQSSKYAHSSVFALRSLKKHKEQFVRAGKKNLSGENIGEFHEKSFFIAFVNVYFEIPLDFRSRMGLARLSKGRKLYCLHFNGPDICSEFAFLCE